MKKILSFFRSMKFGMLLLALVMLLSLAGSLVPQREEAMRYVRLYGAEAAVLLRTLGVTDLFHTWYFYALELLLCVNLLLCSVTRFPGVRRAAERLRERAWAAGADHPLTREAGEALDAFLLSRRFRRREKNGEWIYEKNAAGFFGSFLTHLSILVILLFGSLALLTPQISDETVMPGERLTLQDGTVIACLSFHIEDETGRLDYASRLSVRSADGARTKEQEIRVNEPLRFGEYKIYQQTYGTAGRIGIKNRQTGAEDVLLLTEPNFLSIDEKNGLYYQTLYPGYLRDAEGNYTLITQSAGRYMDPVYSVRTVADGAATSVLAFPGEEITLGDITFSFLSPVEYPGLRIKRVSSWLMAGLYAGFLLMVAALYLCFFKAPVCVRRTAEGYAVLSPKSAQGLLTDLQAALEDAQKKG